MPDVEQAVFIAIDERAEQDASHDAEDSGIGANAQGQSQHYGNSETLCVNERPGRELEVPAEAHEGLVDSGARVIVVYQGFTQKTPLSELMSNLQRRNRQRVAKKRGPLQSHHDGNQASTYENGLRIPPGPWI